MPKGRGISREDLMKRLSPILLLLGLLYGSAEATTWYVATTGNDTNPCTVGSPCLTIEYVYENKISAGDTLLVQPGTYTGGGRHNGYGRARLAKAGTAGSPITIKSVTRGGAILDGGADVNMPYYFFLEGASYNIIDGFVITNTYRCGISQWGGQSNQFINNEIHHVGTGFVGVGDCGAGIWEDPASNGNYIGNNYIHHCPSHALYLTGDNTTVFNNLVTHNGMFGLQMSGNIGVATNMKVYNNVFASNARSGIVIWLAHANHEIKNNIFYQNLEAGISLWDSTGSGIIIDNNVSYGNVQGDLIIGGGATISYTATNWLHSDPLFVNAAALDFHLQSGSPAINTGLTLSAVTTDYDGFARPQGAAYDIGAYEFPAGVVSLALNKPAVASSSETATLTPAKAFDGSATTRWASAYSDPQWIYVDLQANYTVDRVRLTWETAYASAFKIQTSYDAVTWADLYSTTTGPGGTQNLTVTPTAARYIRMYGTVRATSWGYSLWEMEVFGTALADVTPPVISVVSATPTTSGATVTWTTDEAADSQVEYGLTTGYGAQTTLDASLVTSHSVAVSGLAASTLYHYRVKSRDAAGNLATSSDSTFETTATQGPPTMTFGEFICKGAVTLR